MLMQYIQNRIVGDGRCALRTLLASCTAAQLANAGLTPPPGVDVANGMDQITLAYLQFVRRSIAGNMRDHVIANPLTEDVLTEDLLFGYGADDFDNIDEWHNAYMEDDSSASFVDLWQHGVYTLLMGLGMRLNITLLTTRYFEIGASEQWQRSSRVSSDGSTLFDSTEIWDVLDAPVVVIGLFCHPESTDGHHFSTLNGASTTPQITGAIRYANRCRNESVDDISIRKV